MKDVELELPKLPKDTGRVALRDNGLSPVMKGKARQNPAVELHEDNKWRITQVLEDTTYTAPHAIEFVVNAQRPTDGLSLTISEIKAIVRVMRLRIEMRQYRRFPIHPVLALSYLKGGAGAGFGAKEKREYRAARILQAHHDGKQLVIQYSQRLLFTSEMAPSSLDRLSRYYLSEPMMTGDLAKNEGDPWRLLQSCIALKIQRRSDPSDADDPNDEKESRSLRQWFSKRLARGD